MIKGWRKKGMTLVELLISLSIIVMMTAVAIPLFSGYQRRSTLSADAQSLAEFFNYARALNNNPDAFSRISQGENRSFEVKITSGNNGVWATLYPNGDPTYIIDQFGLNPKEKIQINGRQVDNFTAGISGVPPEEKLSCDGGACDTLTLKIYLASDSSVFRSVVVKNSVSGRLFSVSVE